MQHHSPRGSDPEDMTGRGCLLDNRGALRPQEAAEASWRALRALGDLTVPGVAFRHPRSAILGPARVSGSATPLPFHTSRIDVGRLIRQ